MPVRFNLNDEVWVKITPKGHEMLKKFYAELKLPMPEMKTDYMGRTKMSVWQMAEYFGSGMYNGCEVPIETEVEFA